MEKEYVTLREEILQLMQKRDEYTRYAYTAAAAIWTAAFTIKNAYLVFLGMFILMPIAVRVTDILYSSGNIAAYLSVFHESKTGAKWETLNYQYRKKYNRKHNVILRYILGRADFVMLQGLNVAIFWLYRKEKPFENLVRDITIIVIQSLIILFTCYQCYRSAVADIKREENIKNWKRIKRRIRRRRKMRTLAKRILSIALSLVLVLGTIPIERVYAVGLSHNEFESKLSSAKALYPSGSQKEEWSVNGVVVGWQCHGYGRWLSWYVWGVDFANGNGVGWSLLESTASNTHIDNLAPGDVVRFRRIYGDKLQKWNHTIFVTAVDNDTICYTDCNSDGKCTIKWEQQVSKSTLDSWLKLPLYGNEASDYGYIAHYTSNTLSGGNHSCTKGEYVYYEAVHPHYKCYRCSICGEVWRNTEEQTYLDFCDSCLNHTCDKVDYVFFEEVHPHYSCYLCSLCGNIWADTESSNFSDSCGTCLYLEKPQITTTTSVYAAGDNITISWEPVECSTYYWINVFKDDVLIVDQSMENATSYTLNSAAIGEYVVFVSANNPAGTSGSSTYSFSVIENKWLEAPQVVASSAYCNEAGCITVSWEPVEGAVSYIYYVSEFPTVYAYETNVIREYTENTSVTFSNLKNGKYLFFVHAINAVGGWGKQSNYIWMDFYNYDYVPTKTAVWNGHLYALYDGEMSWDLAQSLCEMENGHLVTITSTEENTVVKSLLEAGAGDGYWIGARNDDINNYEIAGKEYRWVTGEAFSYSDWFAGEPNGMGSAASREHFAEVRKSYGSQWNDVPHTTKNGFILELDVSKFAPVATGSFAGNQYLIFDENITWTEANDYCKSIGGHLATISSTEEDEMLSELLSQSAGRKWYYIGASEDSGKWTWCDGTEVPFSESYANWGDMYGSVQSGPTGWGRYLMKYKSTGTWIGIQNCYLPKSNMNGIGFICEIENVYEEEPVCTHTNKTETPFHAADCEHSGNNLYYICDSCGIVLKADGITETTIEAETISALGHDWMEACCTTPKTCKTCGITEGDPLGHSFDEWMVILEATCCYVGEAERNCKNCDYYETREIIALGHTEVIDKAVEATCTISGKTEGSHCDRCGEILVPQEGIPAKGHNWDDGKVTKDPTEETEGEKTFTCVSCGEAKTETLPKLEHVHSYTEQVTKATCTEQGYTTYTCSCGESYKDNYVNALGHTEVIDKAIAATCTSDGKTEGKYCSVCNEVLVKQEVVKAIGHEFGAWTTVTEPTEETEGKEVRQCEKCDATEEKVLSKLDHIHKYAEKITKPTCTEQGYTAYTCPCGESYKDNYVNALGHTEVIDKAIAATCTSDGKTEGKYCSVCNEVLVKQEVVKAIGHEFGAWTTVTEPTEETEGKEVRQCEKCDATEEKVLSKLDHIHKYAEKITKPTCTEKGYTTYTCECGDSYVDNYVEAGGHAGSEWLKDENQHWQICVACEEKINAAVHDGDPCTVCGYVAPSEDTHEYQLGDVNHDTKINAKDATLILQKSVGVLKETAKFCEECAEVSGDGKLNAKDSTLILQYSVGLRDSFPAGA